ncbi:RNA polymerase sporulation sigma factor SigK [Tannockella kyphosi]|uniref:RNA polymerase sporulation sigma factor SigK n=1 Tax=Tannockella kyphosi TaxID=2899121 RepID=UPI0020128637|nr:RNA polymerase sporulation sigma factor SigK [Tannockella kyphosi]
MFLSIMSLLSNIFFVSYVKTQTFEKPLSKLEEQEYLEKLFQGDKNARNILIERNLRLVAHVAKKYENKKDLQEDLISIGTVGLIKGVDNYKPEHKTKLATYVARCIENEILMHLRTNKKTSLDVSMNEIIGSDKDGSEIILEDLIPDKQIPILDQIVQNDSINKLKQYYHILTTRELKTITMRYGLNQTTVYTQKQIAKELNISRSYVSRLEKRALIKLLKEYLKDNQNESFKY